MRKRTIDDLMIGDTDSFEKTISESDVYLFAGITGDMNPAHINKVAASEGVFKDRVAHGILTAGFISAVLGTKLPGPGAVYVAQTLSFKAPVYIGDTIRAEATVTALDIKKTAAPLRRLAITSMVKLSLRASRPSCPRNNV